MRLAEIKGLRRWGVCAHVHTWRFGKHNIAAPQCAVFIRQQKQVKTVCVLLGRWAFIHLKRARRQASLNTGGHQPEELEVGRCHNADTHNV